MTSQFGTWSHREVELPFTEMGKALREAENII